QTHASEHTSPQSNKSRLQAALTAITARTSPTPLETMEHLAILKRWYYRGRRAGEIFFADESGTLPWRRIVRGIARVYRGEQAQPAEPSSALTEPATINPPSL